MESRKPGVAGGRQQASWTLATDGPTSDKVTRLSKHFVDSKLYLKLAS